MSKFLIFLIFMIYITKSAPTWSKTGIKSQVFLSVDFPTEQNGYVSAGAGIYTTSDGGKNFTPVRTPSIKLSMANACSAATNCVATGLSFVGSLTLIQLMVKFIQLVIINFSSSMSRC